MNTLSRAITARLFQDPNSYNALRKQWSDLINSDSRHELSAAHHLLYLALLGKDWRKAFTPPTNQRKLDNGAFFGWGLFRALEMIQLKHREEKLLSLFKGSITPQMLNELRGLLPKLNAYHHKPSDFSQRAFPVDAFTERASTDAIVQTKETSSE